MFMISCGSKRVLEAGELKSDLSSRGIIKRHYDNKLDFNTIRGRIRIDYSEGDEGSKSFTVSLRMQKDSAIWISAALSVVKAYITPERMSFYNKLDNTYFEGDFEYLSKLLGTEVDFQILQNLLLGQSIVDLRDEPYYASISNNYYQLKPETQKALYKTLFLLEPGNFKMAMQQISQPESGRLLNIAYENYQNVNGRIIPNKIRIIAEDGSVQNRIDIEYNNIEFDQQLSFPYKIPNGFRQLTLD
ncbi:DUF4292 domain-containing protein [Robertkochia solimangrovi]|nr:DUF4292 domain-containing protein [Robertkochia solimangrovi]